MRIVFVVLVALAACERDSPRPLPPTRPADFTLHVDVTGGVAGVHDTFTLAAHRLTVAGFGGLYDVEVSDDELDAIYRETLHISRVQNRPPHRTGISDDFYASLVATGGGARSEVAREREASDVIALVGSLSGIAHKRGIGPVELPAVRPDDFSVVINVSGFRGNRRGNWSARIDARRSYVSDDDWSESSFAPTGEDRDRVYAMCRALAASSVELPRAGGDDEDYYVSIVAGRRWRMFAGSVASLPADLRAQFTGLRSALDAMVPADGPPWPERVQPGYFRLELVVVSSADRRPSERYDLSNGRLSGVRSGGAGARNADFTASPGEVDAIYALARGIANHAPSPAPAGSPASERIHLIMSAEGNDRVLDSSRHELGADVAALRQQLATTVFDRGGP